MSNLNLSNVPPRRLAPGTATPVAVHTTGTTTTTTTTATGTAVASALLTARLTSANTVTSSVTSLHQPQEQQTHQATAATSCPDSPIRRVSSSLKNSALDFASRFFNKCKAATFTVDGATYTIVASTPETLPGKQQSQQQQRDEANSGAGGSSGISNSSGGGGSNIIGGGTTPGAGGAPSAFATSGSSAESPTVCDLGPNATINGQVARHGSLTIIRRTNSRNFSQIDAQQSSISTHHQQQLTSPSPATTGPSVGSINYFQTPLSDPLAERLSSRANNTNGSGRSIEGSAASNQYQLPGTHNASAVAAAATASVASYSHKMQPSSPNLTNYAADNVQNTSNTTSAIDMNAGGGRESADNQSSININRVSLMRGDQNPTDSVHSFETTSNLSVSPSQWDTENLPPVDTPDALNKAAGRIRGLLRRMDYETVAYEDMQRNLHYAARVLEAVFIDESSETNVSKERCNGNCKNLNCSQHIHSNAGEMPQQDNNNTNSNCSLQKDQEGERQQQQQQQDNQPSIESRIKGVSLAPQTHSGPTGPPSEEQTEQTEPGGGVGAVESSKTGTALESITESPSVQEEEHSALTKPEATPTTAATTTTELSAPPATSVSTAPSPSMVDAAQSVSSSSSCSNKATVTVQRQRRLRTPVWARSMSTNKTTHVKENHGANIFGVTFNTLVGKDEPQVFATAGSNRCTIYECPRNGGIQLLHCYADPDPDEVFYTCAWSYDLKSSAPLLAAAGYRGIIRVIDIEQNEAVGNYIGHGQAINELKFHPHKLQLLLSGSKDHAIRLWNIQSHVCIAIFGGVEGHRDEVLSIDFNMRGDRIVSSGMDHSLKLWCLNTPEFQHKIELSESFNQDKSTLPFPTITKHFPDFSTRDIHRNYVDCVQWFGNFVLSKSCENSIVCWKPGQLHQTFEQVKPSDSSCTIIAEFEYDECEIWFVRFGFNPWQKVIALGNQQGKVYVWEMDPSDPEGAHMTTLYNTRSVATVRQIAFSRDASVLVYVCDDATVWRWNRRQATSI